MSEQSSCCPCWNRGKCGSCICTKSGKPCTNCTNPSCRYKTNQVITQKRCTQRFQPYAGSSARNIKGESGSSANADLQERCSPVIREERQLSSSLCSLVENMTPEEMRVHLKNAIDSSPHFMEKIIEQGFRSSSSPEDSTIPPHCICKNCALLEDGRMNTCCGHIYCITMRPEFKNLCLRHDVIEIANILNWSYQTNLPCDFKAKTYRNQAYRNFILWQHGKLGASKRKPLPSCAYVKIRQTFPEADGVYQGYNSANSETE